MSKGESKYSRLYMDNEPDFRLWQLISNARILLAKYRSRELLQYGIPRNYSWTLNIIKNLGERATPSEIARYSPLEKHSISEMLNRMVNRGLIVKEARGNYKEPLIRLTPKGLEARRNAHKRESIHRAMSVLSPEEIQYMLARLERIISNVGEMLVLDEEAAKAKKAKARRKTNPSKED